MPQNPTSSHLLLAAVFAPLGDEGRVRRVEARIEEAISVGVLKEGDRLPSESEMASSMGVATVTAREALVGLRSRGLVTTRRGREGGSFVTVPRGSREEMLRTRLSAMTRVELRDHAVHFAAIISSCAELAAGFADSEDLATLRALLEPEGEAMRAGVPAAEFLLELAALSQSARLTREHIRLQSEFGSLLNLPHTDADFGEQSRAFGGRIVAALENQQGGLARDAVNEYVDFAVEWLITEHTRLRESDPSTPVTTQSGQRRAK